jgi:hypothetical protein
MQRILKIGAGLAFVVFLAWVIVPKYLQARNRSRQKHTMADMRSVATAWEARAAAINSYSVGGGQKQRVTATELARSLEPTYIRKLPRMDAWGTEFQLAGQAETYIIRSLGSDGRSDRIANLGGPRTNFSDDLIYSNGSFVRYPEDSG